MPTVIERLPKEKTDRLGLFSQKVLHTFSFILCLKVLHTFSFIWCLKSHYCWLQVVLWNMWLYFRHHRYYSKKIGRWSAYPVRQEKQYPYVSDIKKMCVQNRIIDPVGMNRSVTLDVEDRRLVSETLTLVPPPPTASLVAKKSRFLSESQNQDNWFVFVIDNPLSVIL